MTVIVIRALPDRWRGFLQSVALEVGVGTFVSPDLRRTVRERIWEVAQDWFPYQKGGSFVMAWTEGGDLHLVSLGEVPRHPVLWDGIPVAILGCKTSKNNTSEAYCLTANSAG
jgi:CRISPR-associated protein Cas2